MAGYSKTVCFELRTIADFVGSQFTELMKGVLWVFITPAHVKLRPFPGTRSVEHRWNSPNQHTVGV